jgi:acetolactate synthase I/II/III large subunit
MASASGGDLVARMLAAEGVDVVFGIIDGSYFGLYASLGRHGIRLVSPRHETSAVHMAGAYARLTGRLGVCIASNGPGAANALPGIAVENGEGNRVLVLTSWRRAPIVGPDRGGTYQYFDQVAVTRPMTKWSGAARSFERIPETLRRAFRVAQRGRPGVVHVTVPEDVLNGAFEDAPPVLEPARYRRTEPLAASPGQVRRCAELLAGARLPLLHVGSGVVHARAGAQVGELARALRAPVTASWGGRPALDERLPQAIPLLPPLVDEVRREADVVLALGTRFGETDWWGKPPHWAPADAQRVIQVDVDEEILGLNKPLELAVLADLGPFLEALIAELGAHDPGARAAQREARLEAFARTRQGMRDFLRAAPGSEDARPMHSAHVPLVCREVFDDDAILVVDGGNTAVWTNLYHENRVPGAMLGTFKFGMLGAGPGQALGAKVACPERQVYCILGDGAMGFHPQEIETAVRNELAVVFLVLCDRQWGMVKFGQGMALDPAAMAERRSLPPERTINTDFAEIRFDRLAESMGAHGERVASARELRPALERSLRPLRGGPRRRRPGGPHVGSGSRRVQGHAPGARCVSAAPAPAELPPPRSVLVTGASGLVGRRVVALLAGRPGLAVVAADVRPPRAPVSGVTDVRLDVRDPALAETLRRHAVDSVVHLAAVVTPGADSSRDLEYSIDVEGTRNVLDACLGAGVGHLVYTSSGAAYGYHADNPVPLRESDPLRGNPEFAYAHHKRLVEEMLARCRAEHPQLAQLVFRPGTILGEHAANPITALFERPLVLGVRGSDAPFVLIWDEDVALCIARGVLEQRTGIYNLAGSGAISLPEIARRLGKPYLALPASWLAAALSTLHALGATRLGPEQVRFLRYRPVLSNERLLTEFGFRPRFTSAECFDHYRRLRFGG